MKKNKYSFHIAACQTLSKMDFTSLYDLASNHNVLRIMNGMMGMSYIDDDAIKYIWIKVCGIEEHFIIDTYSDIHSRSERIYRFLIDFKKHTLSSPNLSLYICKSVMDKLFSLTLCAEDIKPSHSERFNTSLTAAAGKDIYDESKINLSISPFNIYIETFGNTPDDPRKPLSFYFENSENEDMINFIKDQAKI